jgi:hypothetical protein
MNVQSFFEVADDQLGNAASRAVQDRAGARNPDIRFPWVTRKFQIVSGVRPHIRRLHAAQRAKLYKEEAG